MSKLTLGTKVIIDKGEGKIVGRVRAGFVVRLSDGSEWLRKGNEMRLPPRARGSKRC